MRHKSLNSLEDVELVLASLIGVECWAVSAGGCVGSRFILHCGDKVPRSTPLKKTRASEDFRRFSGSALIDVGSAAWKLCDATSVVTSWNDSADVNGGIVTGLGELIGQRITSARIEQPGFDLELRFGEAYTLNVFSDGMADVIDNYDIVVDGREISAEFVRV